MWVLCALLLKITHNTLIYKEGLNADFVELVVPKFSGFQCVYFIFLEIKFG